MLFAQGTTRPSKPTPSPLCALGLSSPHSQETKSSSLVGLAHPFLGLWNVRVTVLKPSVALSDSEAHRWLSRRCLTQILVCPCVVPYWEQCGSSLSEGWSPALTHPAAAPGTCRCHGVSAQRMRVGIVSGMLVRKQRLQRWMAPASPGWSPSSLISPEPALHHRFYSITPNCWSSPDGS